MPKKVKCSIIVSKTKGSTGKQCPLTAKYKCFVQLDDIITAIPLCKKHSKMFDEGSTLVCRQEKDLFLVRSLLDHSQEI